MFYFSSNLLYVRLSTTVPVGAPIKFRGLWPWKLQRANLSLLLATFLSRHTIDDKELLLRKETFRHLRSHWSHTEPKTRSIFTTLLGLAPKMSKIFTTLVLCRQNGTRTKSLHWNNFFRNWNRKWNQAWKWIKVQLRLLTVLSLNGRRSRSEIEHENSTNLEKF